MRSLPPTARALNDVWAAQVRNVHCAPLGLGRREVDTASAAALVHAAEAWDWHDVGPVDTTRVEDTWAATMRLALMPVYPPC
jgi:hypothetical protein